MPTHFWTRNLQATPRPLEGAGKNRSVGEGISPAGGSMLGCHSGGLVPIRMLAIESYEGQIFR